MYWESTVLVYMDVSQCEYVDPRVWIWFQGSERYQVWHMSMPLTLAFCYLAMLHTKHLVSEATIVK